MCPLQCLPFARPSCLKGDISLPAYQTIAPEPRPFYALLIGHVVDLYLNKSLCLLNWGHLHSCGLKSDPTLVQFVGTKSPVYLIRPKLTN